MASAAGGIKTSKYRFVTGKPCRPDKQFLNMAPTSAIWDCSNFIAANSKYIAVPWSSLGSVAVLKHDMFGKLPSMPPMFTGHSGPVIDVAFHPFDDSLLFTASEDCTVKGWKIPEEGLKASDLPPVVTLAGHSKKVGILSWHPSAENVLATGGVDGHVMIWDVTRSAAVKQISTRDVALSVNWNLDGSMMSMTTKDKHLCIVDPRSGSTIAAAEAHQGSKTQRSVWAKRRNVLVTLGFNKSMFRQAMVWDPRNISKPLHVEEIDQATSVMMPFMDEDTNMLYVAGKGDTSMKYYELWNETTPIVMLNQFSSTEPQKGLCMVPKSMMDVRECEVARFYKLSTKNMISINFHLPRKASNTEFQEDIYPPTFASKPAMTAAEFFAGTNSAPLTVDLRALFDRTELVTGGPMAAVDTTVAAVVSAKPDKSPAAPAAEPAAPVAVVAAKPVWDGVSPVSEELLSEQRKKVEALHKELTAAEELLGRMERSLPVAAGVLPVETPAVVAAVEPVAVPAEAAPVPAAQPAEPAAEAPAAAKPAETPAAAAAETKPAEPNPADEVPKPASATAKPATPPPAAAAEEAKPAEAEKHADAAAAAPAPAEPAKAE